MPSVRFDRFLASTALVALLSAAAGGAFAGPANQPSLKLAQSAANAAIMPEPRRSSDSAATATDQTDQTDAITPPATMTPDEPGPSSGEAPATANTPSGPADDSAAPATVATPSSTEPAAAPTAPATATAPESPAQPAAAPTQTAISDADAAIAEKLHDLVNGKFDRVIGGKKERIAIEAFYAGRNHAPLWITDGQANERAVPAIAYLQQGDTDGLDSADYPTQDFANMSDPAALGAAELRLSASVIAYAHHAAIGRVHWTRVSGDISYEQKAPEPADVLTAIAAAKDVAAALDGYEPHEPGYLALKAKLAEIRAGKAAASKNPIPNGPLLKAGMQDERVPQLRTRLGLSDAGDTTYDKALADAVKNFQREHDIKPTGTLTTATVEALNGQQPERPTDIILANMERWRWMPHDLGKTYVIVNLPDFSLRVMHEGKQVWTTRIVDGKPTMPTPIMSAEMKYITVNPTWNVPPSIVAREYMPALQQDPTVLTRMGLTVSRNPDGTVHISQPPGDRNALGRLRFNFPNKFLVYQHDTPDKQLFVYEKRAFSHGCMRVQDPAKYAEVLLSLVRPGQGYTQERIRRMFGAGEQDIQFPNFIPVHLSYQTAFVDDAGNLEFRDDVYGRDKALIPILKNDGERKVADIPVERRESSVRREALAMPDSQWGGRSFFGGPADNGGGFFSRLFGAPPPQPVQRRGHQTAQAAQAARANRDYYGRDYYGR